MNVIEELGDISMKSLDDRLKQQRGYGIGIDLYYKGTCFYLGSTYSEESERILFDRAKFSKKRVLENLLLRIKGVSDIECWKVRNQATSEIADAIRWLDKKVSNLIISIDDYSTQRLITTQAAPYFEFPILGLGDAMDKYRTYECLLIPATDSRLVIAKIEDGKRVVVPYNEFDDVKTIIDVTNGSDLLSVLSSNPEEVVGYAREKGYRCK